MILKAVFIDRDGVINEEVDYLNKASQVKLIPGSAIAIRRLNEEGIPVIVITNQSGVARGLCTESELARIHERLKELLKEAAEARLDAIYYCPHYPDLEESKGNPEYITSCDCRKPDTGMIRKALKDFSLEIEGCVVIGDKTSDIETGRRAGCRTIMVKSGYGGSDKKYDAKPDYTCQDLDEAVSLLLDDRK